jgi:hypothetical protein
MKVVTFAQTNAHFIRLETKTAVNDFAAATEISLERGNILTGIKS